MLDYATGSLFEPTTPTPCTVLTGEAVALPHAAYHGNVTQTEKLCCVELSIG